MPREDRPIERIVWLRDGDRVGGLGTWAAGLSCGDDVLVREVIGQGAPPPWLGMQCPCPSRVKGEGCHLDAPNPAITPH